MPAGTETTSRNIPFECAFDERGTFSRGDRCWIYVREQLVSVPRAEVYAFFERPRNLGRLMPARMRFELVTPTEERMHEGQVLAYRFRFLGVPMRWIARLSEIVPGVSFVDEQTSGPFAYWRHEHSLRDVAGGTQVRDHVSFRSPLGPLGRVADALFVKRSIEELFDHRCAYLQILLDEESSHG
jgi:ligand-binding SRPBCC domain-containing protein